MKIFILMGGSSSEKDISIKTGEAVLKALSKKYTNIQVINSSFEKDTSFLSQINKGDQFKLYLFSDLFA